MDLSESIKLLEKNGYIVEDTEDGPRMAVKDKIDNAKEFTAKETIKKVLDEFLDGNYTDGNEYGILFSNNGDKFAAEVTKDGKVKIYRNTWLRVETVLSNANKFKNWFLNNAI